MIYYHFACRARPGSPHVKQVIEEYQANGNSGPFAVRSNSAIANSDKVELVVRDKNQANLVKQVIALQRYVDYNPSRAWWVTSRLAGKLNTDRNLPAGQQKYNAWLLGGRAVVDVAPKWDLGVLASVLYSPQGKSRQYAYGAEVGYQLARNLYLSVGHNLSGFTDTELTGADYTAHGTFLRLRFKFDEKTFKTAAR